MVSEAGEIGEIMHVSAARRLAVMAVLALILGACGNAANAEAENDSDVVAAETEPSHDESEDGHDEAEHSDEAFAFGEPAEPEDVDRTIEVEAKDDLSFEPNAFGVEAGETIQFVVTNSGSIPHDFTLGDQAAQDAHEEEMSEGGMEHSDPNAIVLEPGETKSLTWKFTEAGTVLIGCHQPGHYGGGMTGTIEVKA